MDETGEYGHLVFGMAALLISVGRGSYFRFSDCQICKTIQKAVDGSMSIGSTILSMTKIKTGSSIEDVGITENNMRFKGTLNETLNVTLNIVQYGSV